jgi:hypothetical protein
MTEERLMERWRSRKRTKKRPERAITTLRAMDDFISALIPLNLTALIYATGQLLTNLGRFNIQYLD